MLPATRAYFPQLEGSGHTNHVLPNLVSGATIGTAMAAVSGRRVLGASSTIAVLCTGLQVVSNEARILGRYLSKKQEPLREPARPAPEPQPVREPASTTAAPRKSTLSSLWDMLARNSPIQPLSDDEYIQRLRDREVELENELAEVERILAYYRAQLPK